MSDTVIKVENLSKRYLIGHRKAERSNYVALRDVIMREVRQFGRKAVDLARGRQIVQGDEVEDFWALEDVSFEVKRGEVLGIIGRNGAGKSTLLKILSRITEPTRGRVELHGRVASLLEVGTGFHPELTGRENIFLNGAVLGMKRAEIRKKFDEIVAFAEIEQFLDTPVKRYSSGMYVRLAFSIAAHLEPEILIVDEVLAVGDAEFQKKCLGRLDEVAHQQGRTVLFVSHDLNAISKMAQNGILLVEGRAVKQGPIADVVAKYLSVGLTAPIYVARFGSGSKKPHVKRIEVLTSQQNGVHETGAPLRITVELEHLEPIKQAHFTIKIFNQYHQSVVCEGAYFPDVVFADASGSTNLVCNFPNLRLNVGQYYLKAWLQDPPGGATHEFIDGACPFEVIRTDRIVSWGWRPEFCTYFEECEWRVVLEDAKAISPPERARV
jgi:lipopolysaccharide transport system ATP-binding protein